jgi:pheromone shutdown protein TraB
MITLVGVGHVFDIERQVRYVIRSTAPGAVAVELDPARYQALKEPQKRGSAPLPYQLLALTQRRMAKEFNGKVGQEMLVAVEEGQSVGAKVLFIDVEASQMFRRLWVSMPIKEKVLMFLSGLTGLVASKKQVEAELERFEENESEYMELMAQEFPTMKKVLIDDRNDVMASRIAKAEGQYGSVLAVVGDGHVDGITKILARPDLRVLRLKDLRAMEVAEGCVTAGNNCDVTIHFTVGTGQA